MENTIKLVVFSLISFSVAMPNVSERSTRVHFRSIHEVPQIVQSDGYQCEIHHVTTPDGYILEMHRIPFQRFQSGGNPNRPVVFLMHGLMSSSAHFVTLGSQYSPAYNLADSGFDVWMGNARGNKLSRFHVSLNPNKTEDRAQFFDFTWEQIGLYDVSSMIDYVLDTTGKEKLHYIGHSQGGTAFLVLNTLRPEYQEKFELVHLLAGVGYMEYFPNPTLSSLAIRTDSVYNLSLSLGIYELFPPITLNRTETNLLTFNEYCTMHFSVSNICDIFGVQEILGHGVLIDELNSVGGAAVKQFAHYGQNIRDKIFRRWNFGVERNLANYNSSEPPIYDLSTIKTEVTMHYTINDNLLDERDVLAMAAVMPNTIARKVARETFTHVDFIFANDAKELVTNYIIDEILKFQLRMDETTAAASSLVFSLAMKLYLLSFSIYLLSHS